MPQLDSITFSLQVGLFFWLFWSLYIILVVILLPQYFLLDFLPKLKNNHFWSLGLGILLAVLVCLVHQPTFNTFNCAEIVVESGDKLSFFGQVFDWFSYYLSKWLTPLVLTKEDLEALKNINQLRANSLHLEEKVLNLQKIISSMETLNEVLIEENKGLDGEKALLEGEKAVFEDEVNAFNEVFEGKIKNLMEVNAELTQKNKILIKETNHYLVQITTLEDTNQVLIDEKAILKSNLEKVKGLFHNSLNQIQVLKENNLRVSQHVLKEAENYQKLLDSAYEQKFDAVKWLQKAHSPEEFKKFLRDRNYNVMKGSYTEGKDLFDEYCRDKYTSLWDKACNRIINVTSAYQGNLREFFEVRKKE